MQRLRHLVQRARGRIAMHRSLALLQLRPVRMHDADHGAEKYPPAFLLSLVCVYVRDGVLHAHSFITRVLPEHLFLSQVYKFNVYYRAFYNTVVMGSLLLTKFEPSSYRTAHLASPTIVGLQWAILGVFALDLGVQSIFLRRRYFLRSPWSLTKIIIVALMILQQGLSACGVHLPGITRAGRAIMLLSRFRNVRRIFSAILGSIPNITSVAVVIAFHVMIFSIVGMQLYHDGEYDHATLHGSPPAFTDVFDGMLDLFVLLTTANFPDVMMPYYLTNFWNSLFFILFMVIGIFFLMNLILAVTYNHFQQQTRSRTLRSVTKRYHATLASFYLLAYLDLEEREALPPRASDMAPATTHISRDRWAIFCELFRPDVPAALRQTLWNRVAPLKDEVSADEFMRMVPLAEARLRPVVHRPRRHVHPRLKALVTERWFVAVTDFLVLLNVLLLLLQAAWINDQGTVDLLAVLLRVVLALFVLEVGAKVYVEGLVVYWRASLTNRVDVVAVVLSTAADLLEATHWDAFQVSGPLRMLRLVRLTRALRVMNFSTFAKILETLAQVLPALMRYVAVVVCVFYMFAILGMEAFAGVIVPGDPALAGTPYDQDDYYANNFDDFGNSMVLLFTLLVVNQWPVFMEAYVAATGTKWARAFFISFYATSVLLTMNVLVAFLIDAFSHELEVVTKPSPATAAAAEGRRASLRQDRELLTDAEGNVWKMTLPQHTLDLYVSMFQQEVNALRARYCTEITFADIIAEDGFLSSMQLFSSPPGPPDVETRNPLDGVGASVVVPVSSSSRSQGPEMTAEATL